MLRNPLASPFILGVSSGAGLGLMAMAWFVYFTGTAGATMPGQWWPSALAGSSQRIEKVRLERRPLIST